MSHLTNDKGTYLEHYEGSCDGEQREHDIVYWRDYCRVEHVQSSIKVIDLSDDTDSHHLQDNIETVNYCFVLLPSLLHQNLKGADSLLSGSRTILTRMQKYVSR